MHLYTVLLKKILLYKKYVGTKMRIFVQWRSISDVLVVQFVLMRVHVSFPHGQN